MPIYIQRVVPKAFGHRTAIFTAHRPNWFQRTFLLMKRREVLYMGNRSKWFDCENNNKPVKKYLAEQLHLAELKFFAKNSKKNDRARNN